MEPAARALPARPERAGTRCGHEGSRASSSRGAAPQGPVLFQLPSFIRDIEATSAGTVDQASGTVTVPPGIRHVTVTLRKAPTDG